MDFAAGPGWRHRVTVADPGTGTGTFLLGVLRKIAVTVEEDEGDGSVTGAINAAVKRLIGFEIQLGSFAVAQLRILAEIVELTGGPPKTAARMFVTNTLGNPMMMKDGFPAYWLLLLTPAKRLTRSNAKSPFCDLLSSVAQTSFHQQ
jgi:hypothetical protein